MAFIVDLWQSILTPGPTPALVKAANFSFAALLAVLIFLLISTHNLHFVALSVLTIGLWVAINWFVKELELEKRRQEKTKDSASTSQESKKPIKMANKKSNQHHVRHRKRKT